MAVLQVISPILPVTIGVIVVVIFLITTIKVASGNEALVITGIGARRKTQQRVVRRVPNVTTKVIDGAEVEVKDYKKVEEFIDVEIPKIRIAGAAFVIPFLQRCARFDLCTREARKDNDTMKTSSGVEIEADWGISYWPNADSIGELAPCIRQFLDKSEDDMQKIIMNAVAGGMRAVVSTMTPREVMIGKETLDDRVQENIADQISELGFKVQIYIHEVRDAEDSTYYQDLAAKDREETRRNAALITAEANREIRECEAKANRQAEEAEIDADVQISQKDKDRMVKKAEFKAEADVKQADAEIAGDLQHKRREIDLANTAGEVEVAKQKQANLAAAEEQKVVMTKAETAKQEAVINSKKESETRQIEAEANAAVAKKDAEGQADAARAKAAGESDATLVTAEAEAKKITLTGNAEAEATRAKGMAEADTIAAKGRAQAEAERALSDARAANDQVNFEIQRIEIEQNARVQIATNVATVMAEVGKNAKFYDLGGSGNGGGKTDLLSRVMSNIPEVLAKANLTGQALNEEDVTDSLRKVADAIIGPFKGNTSRDSISTASADAVSDDESNGEVEPEEAPAIDLTEDGEDASGDDVSAVDAPSKKCPSGRTKGKDDKEDGATSESGASFFDC